MSALNPWEYEALLLSLKVSGISALIGLPIAILVSTFIAGRGILARVVISGIIHLPFIVPPVVMGFFLLLLFGLNTPIGSFLKDTFNIKFAFNMAGATLATCIMTLPFQIRAIWLCMDAVDQKLIEAAQTIGANKLSVFFTIKLPLVFPGAIAGFVTAFSAGLGEFGAIITFVSNIPGETQTLPLAIYTALQAPGGEETAIKLSLLAIGLGVTGLFLSELAFSRLKRKLR